MATTTETPQSSTITAPEPQIASYEKHGYLFGHPVAHSMSPLMHNTAFSSLGLNWKHLPLESTDMSQFLRLLQDPRLFGSSVTMPHKVAIIPHLDAVTPECQAVGACNTIYIRDGKFIGTNTDTIGVRESFYQNVSEPDRVLHGRPGLVVGGGGAARSAVYALVYFLKCPKVYLVNRDPGEVKAVIDWCASQGYGHVLEHVATVEQAESVEGVGAIVACVPNFAPVTEAEKVARRITELFLAKEHKGAILEMCYHPTPWTEIAELSERAGWQVILGTEASIYQGLEQDRLWTGKDLADLPAAEVKAIVASELSKSRL